MTPRLHAPLGLVAIFAIGSCTGPDNELTQADQPDPCDGPTADIATPMISIKLGETATIVGTGTVCAEKGDPIYTWNVDAVPQGSATATSSLDLGKPTEPSVTPDMVGTYVVSLVVSDTAGATSATEYAVIEVSSGNAKPIADCGGNQVAEVDQRVDFDGSASADPEGAALEYRWTLTAVPDCSERLPSDIYNGATAVASIVPDCSGVFLAGLVVSDGENWSEPAYCSVSVAGENDPPIADAGDSATLAPCTDDDFQLDGFGSYDPEGEPLTYSWSVVSAPPGTDDEEYMFNDPTLPNPIFHWTATGEWIFLLQVFDGVQWSAPDIVTLTFVDESLNEPPIANAGDDKSVSVSPECDTSSYTWTCEDCPAKEVKIDGSMSDDPVDGDELDFHWVEVGSSDLDIVAPYSPVTEVVTPTFPATFGTTLTKTWTMELTASDCNAEDTDTMVITYTCTPTYTP
jgi:hypothetical protein